MNYPSFVPRSTPVVPGRWDSSVGTASTASSIGFIVQCTRFQHLARFTALDLSEGKLLVIMMIVFLVLFAKNITFELSKLMRILEYCRFSMESAERGPVIIPSTHLIFYNDSLSICIARFLGLDAMTGYIQARNDQFGNDIFAWDAWTFSRFNAVFAAC